MQLSKRILSAKEKGRKGGYATARKSSQEFLEARSQKGGQSTRDSYGTEFYSYLRGLCPKKRNKSSKDKIDSVTRSVIKNGSLPKDSLELIQAASKLI